MNASAESTKILLEQGANIEARDDDNRTSLWWAVAANSLDKVRLLLEHKAKVSIKDSQGKDALSVARANIKIFSSSDTPQIIALLRKYGAK